MGREIRYIELKSGYSDDGPAFISWVTFSKSRRMIYWKDRQLQRFNVAGGNHVDLETGEKYWVSGIKKNGEDRHWAGSGSVVADDDAREEYERLLNERVGRQGKPRP